MRHSVLARAGGNWEMEVESFIEKDERNTWPGWGLVNCRITTFLITACSQSKLNSALLFIDMVAVDDGCLDYVLQFKTSIFASIFCIIWGHRDPYLPIITGISTRPMFLAD